jgi:hypothetical protein
VTIFVSQPIIDVENVIVILIVVTFIVGGLTRLGEHPPRIVRRFVSELRVADVIRLKDVGSQLPQWLCHLVSGLDRDQIETTRTDKNTPLASIRLPEG